MLPLSSILLLISALEFNEARSLRKQYDFDSSEEFLPAIVDDLVSTRCEPAVIDPGYELLRALALYLNPDTRNKAAFRKAIKKSNLRRKGSTRRKSKLSSRRQYYGSSNDYYSPDRGYRYVPRVSTTPLPFGSDFATGYDKPSLPYMGFPDPMGGSDDDDYGEEDYSDSYDDDDDYNSGDMNYNYNLNVVSRRNADAKAIAAKRRSHNNHHQEETRRRTVP